MRLLIDTNVWLDSFIPERPGSSCARELLSFAAGEGHDVLYAVTTPRDVEYIATATYKKAARAMDGQLTSAAAYAAREFGWACAQSLMRSATAVGADQSGLWLAEKYHAVHPDFDDDMVLAATTRAKADYLVTNDTALLSHAPVAALSTEDMFVLLKADQA